MKRVLLASLLVLVAAAPAQAARPGRGVDRGIVQSISPTELVLRSLDGSTLVFQVRPLTRVLVNGQAAAVSAIQTGFAVTVLHDAQGRVRAISAVGERRVERQIDKGAVVSVSPSLLVLREADGSVVSISVGPRTAVSLGGLAARITDLRPGDLAAVLHYGTAPAREVRALPRTLKKPS